MNPGVMNFLDHLSVGGSSASNIEEIVVDELPEVFSGCNIKDLEIRQQTDIAVLVMCVNKDYLPLIVRGLSSRAHSKLYVLGK